MEDDNLDNNRLKIIGFLMMLFLGVGIIFKDKILVIVPFFMLLLVLYNIGKND